MPINSNKIVFQDNYSEIYQLCNQIKEPVLLSKEGHEELAVMSLDTYHKLIGRYDLYTAIEAGMNQIDNGQYVSYEDMKKHFDKLNEK
ncbi:MAG: antitoxin PHD [Candidatus Cloacimonetes bacterium]|nr:antitoxin PHD [Candidatus Cloacimonadota bacterium]